MSLPLSASQPACRGAAGILQPEPMEKPPIAEWLKNGINAIIPMAEFATELNKLNDRLKGKGALLSFGQPPA